MQLQSHVSGPLPVDDMRRFIFRDVMQTTVLREIGNRPTGAQDLKSHTDNKERGDVAEVKPLPGIVGVRGSRFDDGHPKVTVVDTPVEFEAGRDDQNQVQKEQPQVAIEEDRTSQASIHGIDDEHRATVTSPTPLIQKFDRTNLKPHSAANSTFQIDILSFRRGVHGDAHPSTIRAMSSLATTLVRSREFVEAEKLYREIISIYGRLYGGESGYTLSALMRLAGMLKEAGKVDEAEKVMRDVLAIRKRTLGEENRKTIKVMMKLVATLKVLERYDEAIELQREVYEVCEKMYGKRDFMTEYAKERLERLVNRWKGSRKNVSAV